MKIDNVHCACTPRRFFKYNYMCCNINIKNFSYFNRLSSRIAFGMLPFQFWTHLTVHYFDDFSIHVVILHVARLLSLREGTLQTLIFSQDVFPVVTQTPHNISRVFFSVNVVMKNRTTLRPTFSLNLSRNDKKKRRVIGIVLGLLQPDSVRPHRAFPVLLLQLLAGRPTLAGRTVLRRRGWFIILWYCVISG